MLVVNGQIQCLQVKRSAFDLQDSAPSELTQQAFVYFYNY